MKFQLILAPMLVAFAAVASAGVLIAQTGNDTDQLTIAAVAPTALLELVDSKSPTSAPVDTPAPQVVGKATIELEY